MLVLIIEYVHEIEKCFGGRGEITTEATKKEAPKMEDSWMFWREGLESHIGSKLDWIHLTWFAKINGIQTMDSKNLLHGLYKTVFVTQARIQKSGVSLFLKSTFKRRGILPA